MPHLLYNMYTKLSCTNQFHIICLYIIYVLYNVYISFLFWPKSLLQNMPPSCSKISKNSADSEFNSKSYVKFSKTTAEFKWARLGSTWQKIIQLALSIQSSEAGWVSKKALERVADAVHWLVYRSGAALDSMVSTRRMACRIATSRSMLGMGGTRRQSNCS